MIFNLYLVILETVIQHRKPNIWKDCQKTSRKSLNSKQGFFRVSILGGRGKKFICSVHTIADRTGLIFTSQSQVICLSNDTTFIVLHYIVYIWLTETLTLFSETKMKFSVKMHKIIQLDFIMMILSHYLWFL